MIVSEDMVLVKGITLGGGLYHMFGNYVRIVIIRTMKMGWFLLGATSTSYDCDYQSLKTKDYVW